MPLGIIELLTRIGEDHVQIQDLLECATNFQLRGKRGSHCAITFLTNQMNPTEVMHQQPRKIGLVLWLPRDLVEKATADYHAETVEQRSK